jgi:hypothetical protein
VTPAAYPRVLHRRSLRCSRGSLRSSSRAGSPLLFGLAPRGVFHASFVSKRAVGSYPTVSPLPAEPAFRRRLAGFPARCHRAPFHRRFIFCGTFREPHRTLSRTLQIPWRYQARCPSVPDLATGNLGVRTFLPSSVISTRTSDHPAHPLSPLYSEFCIAFLF